MKVRFPRLQADLNRHELTFGRCRADLGRRQLFRNGQVVTLNGKAFDLLAALLEKGGCVLTREELYQRLWGEAIVEDANLSQTIYLLRRALDPNGDGRAYIETIPRIGYRFVPALDPPRRASSRRPLGIALASVAAAVLCAVMLNDRPTISSTARAADELGEYHLALRSAGHLAYALGYFKRAEAAAPHDALAYADAAATYALLAEYQPSDSARQHTLVSDANASAAAALQRDAGFSRAFAVLGFIAYRFRDDDAAGARDLQRALALDPNDAQAHLWRGVLWMRDGDLAAATAEFQEAHRLAPTSEVNARWLARAYAFEGEPDQAIAEAQETLRIEPDDAPAILTIAQIQEQRGHLEAALSTLRALARQDPTEEPYVAPDAARLEVRLGKADPVLVARHVSALARAGRADSFETALLYFTIGRKAAGLQMLRRTSFWDLAIQRYDPRLLAVEGLPI